MASSGFRVRADWRGNRVLARIPIVRRRALQRAGHQWLARSQAIVPLREGHLLRTGKMTMTDHSVTVAYGQRYGAIQHQNLTYRHLPGRQAKYITDAVPPGRLQAVLAEVIREMFH
ncbi:hypothetical protein [Frankia sp. CeD]|uniref:hypothetical protein n=1 Tax=Frankia sp. CeD TaxID=258230 RepID=UPI0004DD04A2|nr:hypothetical protein [Frankia sp. CeD]KEZ35853.1 hypothetical protein CEDDRAFT_02849 [Frankia sp. CeD]